MNAGWSIQDPFATCRSKTPVLDLDETGSTNAKAMQLAASGESGPLWVCAKRQTAGRGRDGRDWTSLDGNLHASLLVTIWAKPSDLPKLSLLAGVALAQSVRALMTARPHYQTAPQLKWPNDLQFGDAKCAGILVETTVEPSGAFNCVLGFGVNIDNAPEIQGRPVTSLTNEGIETTPKALLTGIERAIRPQFSLLAEPDGFSRLRKNWLTLAHPIGTPLSVRSRHDSYSGHFAGLDEDGALLLKDGTGSLRKIAHGDVSAGGSVV